MNTKKTLIISLASLAMGVATFAGIANVKPVARANAEHALGDLITAGFDGIIDETGNDVVVNTTGSEGAIKRTVEEVEYDALYLPADFGNDCSFTIKREGTNDYARLTAPQNAVKMPLAGYFNTAFSKIPTCVTWSVSFDIRKDSTVQFSDFRVRMHAGAGWVDSAKSQTLVNALNNDEWVTFTTEPASISAKMLAAPTNAYFELIVKGDQALAFDIDNIKMNVVYNNGQNIYPYPGFDGILEDGEESKSYQGNSIGAIGNWNAGNNIGTIMREGDNVFLRASKDPAQIDTFFNGFHVFPFELEEARNYQISMKVRRHDEATTDNFRYGFYYGGAWHQSGSLHEQVNAAPVGEWTTISDTYYLEGCSSTAKCDSMQIFFNLNNMGYLDLDDIEVKAVAYEAEFPEAPTTNGSFQGDSPADVTFTVDLKHKEVTSVVLVGTDGALTSSAYTIGEGTITFKKEFLATLPEGEHIFTLTTEGGSINFTIVCYAPQAQIPNKDDYKLVNTMFNGDFEDSEEFPVGLSLGGTQTANAWGTVSADASNPAVVCQEDNGNKYLRCKRGENGTSNFSSFFCITSPDIVQNDWVTLEFDYQVIGTPEVHTNVCFVGGTNVSYHRIDLLLDGSQTMTAEGNASEGAWPVAFSNKEGGWKHVEMTFKVDFAFLNATNSLRFLLNVPEGNNAELWGDNVKLWRWTDQNEVDETPTMTPTSATFDASKDTDVKFGIDLKDNNITVIRNTDLDKPVSTSNYSVNDEETELTISGEYLSSLGNGEHNFVLRTLGGEVTFKVTVTGVGSGSEDEPDQPAKKGCGAAIISGPIVATAALAGILFLLKKKREE